MPRQRAALRYDQRFRGYGGDKSVRSIRFVRFVGLVHRCSVLQEHCYALDRAGHLLVVLPDVCASSHERSRAFVR